MKKLLVLLIFAVGTPLLAQEPVGKIVDLSGEAWITHTGGKPVVAFLNQEIRLGDKIQTKANGAAKVLFVDDTILTIKEDSSVLITEFLFNAKAKQRNVVLNTQYGRIRALIGKFFGKDQPVEIRTPTAVAGIRGTDIAALVQPKATTFYCFICEPDRVSIFNVKYAEKAVSLATEQSIEVIVDEPASEKNIAPVPEGTQPIFEIQKGEADKAVQKASKEEAKEASGEETLTKKEESVTKSLLEKGEETKAAEKTIETTTPSTADTDTTVNPGGKTENTTSPTIKITLP